MIGAFIAALTSIPKLVDLFSQLIAAVQEIHKEMRDSRLKEELKKGIEHAKQTGDTSSIESAWAFDRKPTDISK